MIPKVISLKIGYESKTGKDKSCLVVLEGTNENKYTIHNIFRGIEADKLIRKLISGGCHENKFE